MRATTLIRSVVPSLAARFRLRVGSRGIRLNLTAGPSPGRQPCGAAHHVEPGIFCCSPCGLTVGDFLWCGQTNCVLEVVVLEILLRRVVQPDDHCPCGAAEAGHEYPCAEFWGFVKWPSVDVATSVYLDEGSEMSRKVTRT